MKTKLRLTALLLASLMALASCGSADEGDAAVTTAGSTTAPTETTAAETGYTLNLPAELNYDGAEVRVLTQYADRLSGHSDSFVTETNSDIVNDALYNRDRNVEELLGVVIKPIAYQGNVTPDSLRNSVLGDEDMCEFMHLRASTFFANRPTYETILLDVASNENLNLEAPWWNGKAMKELSFNGESIKYLIGDISVSSISGASVIFYNKNMFDDLYHNPEQPYSDVIDGTWTVDKFAEYAKGAYEDVNGDSKRDQKDTYGMAANQWMIRSFYNGFSDIQFYTRDNDNLVALDIDLDRATVLATKLYDLVWNNNGVFFSKVDKYHDNAPKYFAEDNFLFLAFFLNTIEKDEFRNMESDYGILPFFKLDETQEEYRTDLNPSGSEWVCLPKTCKNIDMATATIEALSYYSYNDVTPIYYEVALKAKYVRDDMSGQVIDIVRESLVTDYLIGIYRSTIGQHFTNDVVNNRTAFASGWESALPGYESQMKEAYAELIKDAELNS